jgi:hypothetical protein
MTTTTNDRIAEAVRDAAAEPLPTPADERVAAIVAAMEEADGAGRPAHRFGLIAAGIAAAVVIAVTVAAVMARHDPPADAVAEGAAAVTGPSTPAAQTRPDASAVPLIRRLSPLRGSVRRFALNPAGTHLLTVGEDHELQLWHTGGSDGNPRRLADLGRLSDPLPLLRFTADGAFAVASDLDRRSDDRQRRTVRVWRVADGTEPADLAITRLGDPWHAVWASLPDGTEFLLTTDGAGWTEITPDGRVVLPRIRVGLSTRLLADPLRILTVDRAPLHRASDGTTLRLTIRIAALQQAGRRPGPPAASTWTSPSTGPAATSGLHLDLTPDGSHAVWRLGPTTWTAPIEPGSPLAGTRTIDTTAFLARSATAIILAGTDRTLQRLNPRTGELTVIRDDTGDGTVDLLVAEPDGVVVRSRDGVGRFSAHFVRAGRVGGPGSDRCIDIVSAGDGRLATANGAPDDGDVEGIVALTGRGRPRFLYMRSAPAAPPDRRWVGPQARALGIAWLLSDHDGPAGVGFLTWDQIASDDGVEPRELGDHHGVIDAFRVDGDRLIVGRGSVQTATIDLRDGSLSRGGSVDDGRHPGPLPAASHPGQGPETVATAAVPGGRIVIAAGLWGWDVVDLDVADEPVNLARDRFGLDGIECVAIALTPDGSRYAIAATTAAGDGVLVHGPTRLPRLHDTGAARHELPAAIGRGLRRIAWSTDGSRLVVEADRLFLLEAESLAVVAQFDPPARRPAAQPAGPHDPTWWALAAGRLTIAIADDALRVIDVRTGAELRRVPLPPLVGPVDAVIPAASPQMETVAVFIPERDQVWWINLDAEPERWWIETRGSRPAAFLPNGDLIAVTPNGIARFDAKTRERTLLIPGATADAITVGADGSRLICISAAEIAIYALQ